MEEKYVFGRDTYYFNDKKGLKTTKYKPIAPPQAQHGLVGREYLMNPLPIFDDSSYIGSGKLKNKVTVIECNE